MALMVLVVILADPVPVQPKEQAKQESIALPAKPSQPQQAKQIQLDPTAFDVIVSLLQKNNQGDAIVEISVIDNEIGEGSFVYLDRGDKSSKKSAQKMLRSRNEGSLRRSSPFRSGG